MPLSCVNRNGKWVLTDPSGKTFGTHGSRAACNKQIQAIEANKSSHNSGHGSDHNSDHGEKVKNFTFDGVVGRDFSLKSLRPEIDKLKKGEETNIFINSPGGSHIEALQILEALSKTEASITTTIESHAFSAGFTLALAGNKRIRMNENAMILIHPISANVDDGPKTSDELRTIADMTDKAQKTLLITLRARTAKGENELNEMIKNTTIMTAQEALEGGLIDEIVPLRTRKVDLKNLERFCENLPDRIVSHVRSFDDSFIEGDATMPLKEVANKLQLDVANVADDDTAIETLIVNHVGKQGEQITNLEKEIKELKEKKPAEKPVATKAPVFVVNMAAKLRNQEIDKLLGEGYVTKASADDMRKDYAEAGVLANCLDSEGNETDHFEKLVATIVKNGKVLNLGGSGAGGTARLDNPNRVPVDKEGKEIKQEDLLVNMMEETVKTF